LSCQRVKELCYISSTAALGDLASMKPLLRKKLSGIQKNHSDYAISKYGAEMEIWRGQQEGLDVIIVNPGIIVALDSKNREAAKRVANGLRYYPGKSISSRLAMW
jgi:thioester reductase-like protein